jgi:cyclase
MSGHSHDVVADPHTVEVADGVFAYVQPDGSWWLNNSGFVVPRALADGAGADGVVGIDSTSTERRTRALLAAIAATTTAPVRTLVNTHHHGDHTNGNCLFADATVIGHRNCRDGVRAQVIGGLDAVFGAVEWGELQIRPPSVVFDDHVDVFAGDRRIELHFIGTPAHTTGDVVAWLPDDGVLFAGDLVFNGGTPFLLMGSVEGAIEACARVREFGVATIVPGHGEVCGSETVDAVERYLRFVRRVAADAHAAGVTPLEAAREVDLGEFADLHDRERIVGNLHRAMAELAGAPRGAPVDVIAAFGDMITYNGGAPLRCLA